MSFADLTQWGLVLALVGGGLGMIAAAALSLLRLVTHRLVEGYGHVVGLKFDEFPDRYTVTLIYRYQVGEQQFTGAHLAFDVDGPLHPDEKARIQQYYPEDQPLPVYYNPRQPAHAQLERGVDDALFLAFVLLPTGGGLLAVGVNWGAALLHPS